MPFPTPSEILTKVQASTDLDTDTSIPSPQDVLSRTQQETSPTPEKTFGQTLKETAGGIARRAFGATKAFFGRRAKDVFEAVSGELDVTPSDLLSGVTDTVKGLGTGSKFLAEGINEGVVRAIQSTSEAVIGPERTKRLAEFGGPVSPKKFAQDITGRERLSSYQEIKDQTRDYALRNNASLDTAEFFSGLAVIGVLFADNPFFAPGKRGLIKFSEDAIRELIEANTDDAIRVVLRKEVPNLSKAEIDVISPVLRNATDEVQIKTVVDQINKAQSAPIRKGSETPPPEKINRNVAEKVREREIVEATAKVPDELKGLRAEVQKFKTAEEFVESFKGKADYVIPVKNIGGIRSDARRFAVEDFKKDVLAGKKIDPIIIRDVENPTKDILFEVVDGNHRLIALKELGIKDIPVLYAVEHSRSPKFGTTITDFFDQVKLEAQQPPTPRQFSPNLLQGIAKEELSGPIADMLQKEFPNISERTRFAFAKALTKMKRTDDITGLLRSAENINNRKTASKIPQAPELKQVFEDDPALKYLSLDQIDNYIDNIRDSIKTQENSVLAQNEFDVLMSQADQGAVDQFNSIQIEREIVREVIENDPARKLLKHSKDGQLPEVTGKSTRRNPDTGKIVANTVFGKRGDDIITELGFENVNDAQKGLDEYIKVRNHLKALDAEARELRPRVRASKILRDFGDEVPVISQGKAGELNSLASVELVENTYKDITGLAGGFRDLWRNSAKFFGVEFNRMKKIILDPFDDAKGLAVDELKSLGDELEVNVINKFNIKKASKESKAIQQFGDTGLDAGDRLTRDQLIDEFGLERATDIMEAEAWLRRKYDTMIDELNAVRARIYPNDPTKLVEKRKDYFRHFQEMGDGFEGISNILFETGPLGGLGTGIDPKLAGISEFTKPKSKFLSFAQQRKAKATEIDAIGGYINYTAPFAYAKHIDPHIANFRYLRRKLAESAQTPGMLKRTGDERSKGINNYLEYLDDFANNLAGKTTSLDRWAQKRIPGGRKAMSVFNWTNNRIKANTILANFGSSVAQLYNLPNGFASAKLYNIPGAERTLASIFQENLPMKSSTFIKERYVQDMQARFKVGWVEHPAKRTKEEALAFGRWTVTVLDEVATKHMWNSHYAEAIAKGIDEPVRFADGKARALVAGRGVGEIPIEQQGRVFKLVAPFQVEVGNAWWVLQDIVDKKDFAGIAILLASNFIMNEMAERVRGSRVVFDPINSLIEGSIILAEEIDDGNYWRAGERFAGRQIGEVISNIPFGQTLASILTTPFAERVTGIPSRELFGEGDPGRFGSGILVANGLSDPFSRLFPPLGGVQAKKTIGGITALVQGEVRDRNGKLSFEVDPDLQSISQAVLFGKYATPEAREFFDDRDDIFQRVYIQDANRENLRMEAEDFWDDMKKVKNKQGTEEAVKMIQELEKTNPFLAEEVGEVADEEASGLNGNERLMKILGVNNGERAKYIAGRLEQLKTKEERASFMQNLDDKGLISDTVFDQLEVLIPSVFEEISI